MEKHNITFNNIIATFYRNNNYVYRANYVASHSFKAFARYVVLHRIAYQTLNIERARLSAVRSIMRPHPGNDSLCAKATPANEQQPTCTNYYDPYLFIFI